MSSNDENINFLNSNIGNIVRFEGNDYYMIVHMKNGEMIEINANPLMTTHHSHESGNS